MASSAPRRLLIVDAMNVIGARPDRWWRDPDAARRRLVDRLRPLVPTAAEAIAVVIDGRPLPDLPEGSHGGILLRYAGRPGPDAADDRIVELVAEDPVGVVVVTSDRELRRRVRELGAEVEGASWLLDRLDRVERGDEAG